jgi:hypothetical protein
MKRQIAFSSFVIVIFCLLAGVTIYRLLRDAKTESDVIIAKDVQQLAAIFKRIDAKCKIIDFESQKNPIGFLNVKGFVGSELGTMNLAYPQRWEGPYVNDNPTVQEKLYMIVKTKKGYFVTPGDGVRLGNGKVIGKDLILDENADIAAMMNDKKALLFEDSVLAVPLHVGVSPVEEVLLENIIRAEDGLVMRDQEKLLHLTADF